MNEKLQNNNEEFTEDVVLKAEIVLEGDWTTEETIEFLNDNGFASDKILKVDGPKATVLWESPETTKYEIEIALKGDWTTEETIDFLSNDGFIPNTILEANGPNAIILWEMPAYGSPEDIDNELFYALKEGKLGTYDYFLAN